MCEFQSLRAYLYVQLAYAGDVAARPAQIRDQAYLHRIGGGCEDDRDCARGSFRHQIGGRVGDDDRDLTADGAGMALWDGTDQRGTKAASGVYFVYAQSGSQSRTFKAAIER